LSDIGWNRGEIEETGRTIQENSVLKAYAVLDFCRANNIDYPIITDDAGLFVDALCGEPGIFTGRYADLDLMQNPELPKHYSIIKLLNKLVGEDNRTAEYRCAVTIMFSTGEHLQFTERTEGWISETINEPIKKPYFYSLFVEGKTGKPFNQLSREELNSTYRFKALNKALRYLGKRYQKNSTL